jgi:hypothetical protein
MWANVLQHLATALGTGLVLWAMFALARRQPQVHSETGTAILRHSWMIKAAALLGIPLTAIGPAVMWEAGWVGPQMIAGAVYTAVFGAGALYAILDAYFTWVAVTTEGILHHTPWRGTRGLIWAEISAVRYSTVNRWFVLVTAKDRLRVSAYMVGILCFIDALRRHLPAEKLPPAIVELRSVADFEA